MRVDRLMTPSPHSVLVDATLQEAAAMMASHSLGCLPVLEEGGALAGMITDRDICVAAAQERRKLDELIVSHFMSTRPRTCRSDDDVRAAAEEMRTHRVRRLAVVGPKGEIVGVLSLDDLAHAPSFEALTAEEIARTLAAVSVRRSYG
jgi:CBS domain-containing protein